MVIGSDGTDILIGLYILILVVVIALFVGIIGLNVKGFKFKPTARPARTVPRTNRPSTLKVIFLGVFGSVAIFGLLALVKQPFLIYILFPVWISVLVSWRLR